MDWAWITGNKEPIQVAAGKFCQIGTEKRAFIDWLATFRVVGKAEFDSLPRRRSKIRLPMVHAVRRARSVCCGLLRCHHLNLDGVNETIVSRRLERRHCRINPDRN
jgi:hypothetical protein